MNNTVLSQGINPSMKLCKCMYKYVKTSAQWAKLKDEPNNLFFFAYLVVM